MTYENFSNKLKQLGLTREEFSKLVGMKYNSVANWKSKEIPAWVDSWLENYEKLKVLEETLKVYLLNKKEISLFQEQDIQKYLLEKGKGLTMKIKIEEIQEIKFENNNEKIIRRLK